MTHNLNLGVASGIITPKVGGRLYGYRPNHFSESVNDDLTATAYCLSEGDTRALIIEATVCAVRCDFCMEIREEIEKITSIPKENIIIHATHTHSGPSLTGNAGWGDFDSEYAYEIFMPKLLRLAEESLLDLEPVKMGVARGDSLVGINRREPCKDGTVKLGQDPNGIFNPRMTVISFKTESGDVKASMVHYGCHGTAAGINTEITRDWSGFMVDSMSEHGAGVCAFFNGPEGDVGPRLMNGRTTGGNPAKKQIGNINHAIELGHYAAHDAVRLFKSILDYREAGLEVISTSLSIPLKPRPSLEIAKAEYEKFKEYTVNHRAGSAAFYENVIKSYEEGYEDKEFRDFEQTIIRIGDVAFVSSSFELFTEIGLRIQKDSPIPHTLPIVNTNGSDAYFVTESELRRGGYEVDVFGKRGLQGYADNGDSYYVNGTLANLNKLKKD